MAVTKIKIEKNYRNLKVQWKPPKERCYEYFVQLHDNNGNTVREERFTTSSCGFENLPATKYYCAVFSIYVGKKHGPTLSKVIEIGTYILNLNNVINNHDLFIYFKHK